MLNAYTSSFDLAQDCERDVYLIEVKKEHPALQLPAPEELSELVENEFSISFWFYLDQSLTDSTPTTVFLSAFDQIVISNKNEDPSYPRLVLRGDSDISTVIPVPGTPPNYCSADLTVACFESKLRRSEGEREEGVIFGYF